MKNITALICLAVALLSTSAFAESFSDKCSEIAPCAKVVSELTGQKYIFDGDVKGKVMGTPNVDINKDNAELLFTEMLNINGFARVPAGEPNTYQIMRQRDARDAPLVIVDSDQQKAPELPHTWDLVTMRYRATHADVVENMRAPAAASCRPIRASSLKKSAACCS